MVIMEFEGKNVEIAIKKASTKLNIPEDKLDYEVVTYGSTGIFGLVGTKKAKIKVSVKEERSPAIDLEGPTKEDIKDLVKSTFEGVDQNDGPREIIVFGKEVLETIVKAISEDAIIDIKQEKEKTIFMITGGRSGVLIGKRGQTLEAIQYLLEKIINKKSRKRERILVDVEGYQEKRKESLKKLATKLAQKSKRIKKPVTIGTMNAHDRRIVHIHLKEEKGIRTQSVGEGYYRKLMIFPKKRGNRKKKNNTLT